MNISDDKNGTKEKIINATYRVIINDSSLQVTARKIAKEAGLSLGLISYHFESVDDIIYLAMQKMINHAIEIFDSKISITKNLDENVESVLNLIFDTSWNTNDNLILSYDLYAISCRNDKFKKLVKYWMDGSHRVLLKVFNEDTAKCLDVFIEGVTLHNFFDKNRISKDIARKIIQSCINIDQ